MRTMVKRNTKQAILRVVAIVVCAVLLLECYVYVVVIADLAMSGQLPAWIAVLAVLVAIGATIACQRLLRRAR